VPNIGNCNTLISGRVIPIYTPKGVSAYWRDRDGESYLTDKSILIFKIPD